MRLTRTIIFSACIATLTIVGCNTSPEHPGYTILPDMQYSEAYETYDEAGSLFGDSLSARKPVKGTIPRGFQPFMYMNTPEDYERAGQELKNPLDRNDIGVLARGEHNYKIYCAICHGDDGSGEGHLTKVSRFPQPPSYLAEPLLSLSEGKMAFSAHYGKNSMGSYASQLSQKERWEVISYIQSLQDKVRGEGSAEATSNATEGNN